MRRDGKMCRIRPDLSRRIIGVERSRPSPLRIQLSEFLLLPGVNDSSLLVCLRIFRFDSVSSYSMTQIVTNLCLQNAMKSICRYAKTPVVSSRFDGSRVLANWCTLRRLWPTTPGPNSLLPDQQISTLRTLLACSLD